MSAMNRGHAPHVAAKDTEVGTERDGHAHGAPHTATPLGRALLQRKVQRRAARRDAAAAPEAHAAAASDSRKPHAYLRFHPGGHAKDICSLDDIQTIREVSEHGDGRYREVKAGGEHWRWVEVTFKANDRPPAHGWISRGDQELAVATHGATFVPHTGDPKEAKTRRTERASFREPVYWNCVVLTRTPVLYGPFINVRNAIASGQKDDPEHVARVKTGADGVANEPLILSPHMLVEAVTEEKKKPGGAWDRARRRVLDHGHTDGKSLGQVLAPGGPQPGDETLADDVASFALLHLDPVGAPTDHFVWVIVPGRGEGWVHAADLRPISRKDIAEKDTRGATRQLLHGQGIKEVDSPLAGGPKQRR